MESIPQVIKEAFYLKIPIIATNVGGIPELITDNETGILIPPNDPKMLESSINKLLLDDETSKKLTDRGYEFVMNNLTWEILLPLNKKIRIEKVSTPSRSNLKIAARRCHNNMREKGIELGKQNNYDFILSIFHPFHLVPKAAFL